MANFNTYIFDNIFVWFYNLHIKYLSKHEGAEPLFEARFSLAASISIIIHNTAHLIGTKYCLIFNKWISVVLFLFIFYLIDKHYRVHKNEIRIIKNLEMSFNNGFYSKSLGLIFFIFMIAFSFISVFLGKYFYDQCFVR